MVTTLSNSSRILFSSWLHTGQILVSSLLHLGFVRLTSWSLPSYILVPSFSHSVLVLARPLVFVLVLSWTCPGSPLSHNGNILALSLHVTSWSILSIPVSSWLDPGVPLFTSWSRLGDFLVLSRLFWVMS